MARRKRGQGRPMPIGGGNSGMNNNMGMGSGTPTRAPRNFHRVGQGGGFNPVGGNTGNNLNVRRNINQDPRFVNNNLNTRRGPVGGGDPRFAPVPNLRQPGSGGSRVMSTPTVSGLNKPKGNRLQRGVFPQGSSRSKKMGY